MCRTRARRACRRRFAGAPRARCHHPRPCVIATNHTLTPNPLCSQAPARSRGSPWPCHDDRERFLRVRTIVLEFANAITRPPHVPKLTVCVPCHAQYRRRPPALCRHERRIEPFPYLPSTRHLLKSHHLHIFRAQISSSPSGTASRRPATLTFSTPCADAA